MVVHRRFLMLLLARASLAVALEQAAEDETPADESGESNSTGERRIDTGLGAHRRRLRARPAP